MSRAKKSQVTKTQEALLDELLKSCSDPKDILSEHGLLQALQKRFIERALEGEMTEHVGYVAHDLVGHHSGNSRNGKTTKTLMTATDQFEIDVPRDRNGTFEPPLVAKRQRRLPGIDEKVIALYSRGASTREIEAFLNELYGIEVSPGRVSNITQRVKVDVEQWQARTLDAVYPIIYFDATVHAGPAVHRA